MSTFIEPLPGLMDDPLLNLSGFPVHADVRIPPLRNPFPARVLSLPSPLEPNAPGTWQAQTAVRLDAVRMTTPPISPSDFNPAGFMRRPDLANSNPVDAGATNASSKLLPPSFVNLAAVENNPAFYSWLPDDSPSKRIKIDHGDHLQLPKPQQRETAKPVPMLPAMVNGIHEPPPSADLLPPIGIEAVEAILATMPDSPPLPKLALHSPDPAVPEAAGADIVKDSAPHSTEVPQVVSGPTKNVKSSRAWKKWSNEETQQLFQGIEKHGAGKWKEICTDPDFSFPNRKPADLKDRFRTCFPGAGKKRKADPSPPSQSTIGPNPPPGTTPAVCSIAGLLSPTKPQLPDADVETQEGSHVSQGSAREANFLAGVKDGSSNLVAALIAAKKQRARVPWTEEEHQAVLRGFDKHGYRWTAIQKDAEFNLFHRKSTDIRDKFRSLKPKQYPASRRNPIVARVSLEEQGTGQSANTQDTTTTNIASVPPKNSQKPIPWTRPTPIVPMPTLANKNNSSRGHVTASLDNIINNTITNHSHQFEPWSSATQLNNTNLPSLSMGDTKWDWEDKKLAPLVDWEDCAI